MHRKPTFYSRRRPTPETRRVRLLVEELETRSLPSVSPSTPVVATGTNVTLDHAQDLQTLTIGGRLSASGTLGTGPGGAADVAFYRFTLEQSARVHLETLDGPQGRHLNAALSLYDTDPNVPDPNNPFPYTDSQDFSGHHLLAQNDGQANNGFAVVDQTVGAGTYYVAVSGSGNDYFNPLLVGSGYAGGTGDYVVRVTGADSGVGPGDGPAILSASAAGIDGALLAGVPLSQASPNNPITNDPASVPQLSASPLLFRLELSSAIDPNTLIPDANVVLNYSPTSDFTDPAAMQVFGVQASFDQTPGGALELEVAPPGPLVPGYYQLVVQGDTSLHDPSLVVLSQDDSAPLGATLGLDGNLSSGQDYTYSFHVAGSEGVVPPPPARGTLPAGDPLPSADDTPATARELGSIAGAGRQQVTGAIGDDPTDPNGFNPNAVELYHFRVVGAGNYAFAAEVFAQRIGSPLDPALSLFRPRASDGQLEFVAGNLNTNNHIKGSDGSKPLENDAALFANLTAGDYYLAVSSGRDLPDPVGGHPQGAGVFDPNVSHSGGHGNSTGPYVLNLQVERALYPPHVVATSAAEGGTLTAPPTTLTVRFDRPVNVQQLAFASTLQIGQAEIAAVFITDVTGAAIVPHPAFASYDPSNNQATFSLLGALPNGAYTLHFSGAKGLADLAGHPLVGNDPSGDYVVRFSVNGPTRGTPGNPTAWVSQANSLANPQVLGPLFPDELQAGVSITRTAGAAAANADYYQFTVLTKARFRFNVGQFTGAPPSLSILADGNSLPLQPQADGFLYVILQPGTYVLAVASSGKAGATETYEVDLATPQGPETGTPLTSGPTPALGLRLVSDAPPPVDPPPTPPAPPSLPPTTPLPTPPPSPNVPSLSPPSDGGGASSPTVFVSTGSRVPIPVPPTLGLTGTPAPGPIPGVGVLSPVAVSNQANPTGIPQLALALSDGPLGGLRGREANAGIPADSPTQVASASPFLAGVVITAVASPVLASGSDFTFDVYDTVSGNTVGYFVGPTQMDSSRSASSIAAFATSDAAWLVNQPVSIAQAVMQRGVEAVAVLDGVLGSLPAPGTNPDRQLDSVTVRPQTVSPQIAGAEIAEQQVTAPVWSEALNNRPFWWSATAFLSVVLGALNANKWLAARRERQLALRRGSPRDFTRTGETQFTM